MTLSTLTDTQIVERIAQTRRHLDTAFGTRQRGGVVGRGLADLDALIDEKQRRERAGTWTGR